MWEKVSCVSCKMGMTNSLVEHEFGEVKQRQLGPLCNTYVHMLHKFKCSVLGIVYMDIGLPPSFVSIPQKAAYILPSLNIETLLSSNLCARNINMERSMNKILDLLREICLFSSSIIDFSLNYTCMSTKMICSFI